MRWSWMLGAGLSVGLAVFLATAGEAQSPGKGKMPVPPTKKAASGKSASKEDRARIERIVKNFDPWKEPNKLSVKSVRSRIEELEIYVKEHERLKKFGLSLPYAGVAEEKAEWLKAYFFWLEERAYPYDLIDMKAMQRGIAQMQQMPSRRPAFDPSQVKDLSDQVTDAPNSDWLFVGPRKLDVPQRAFFGITPNSGRVSGIAISHQTPADVWYVSSGQGGLFKTTDGGVTFSELSLNWPTTCVGDVVVSPTTDQIVYAGTGDFDWNTPYSAGVMRSTNGGTSWTQLGATDFGDQNVSDINLHPDDPTEIYVTTGRGANGGGYIWRSTNSGNTWTQALSTFADWYGTSFSTSVGGVRYIWAVGSGGRIRRSTNGTTWTTITPPAGFSGVADIACSKVSQQTVYLLASNQQDIWKTTNNGASWTNITAGFINGTGSDPDYNWSQSSYDWYIETGRTDAAQDIVVVGLIDIVASRNGGATWFSVGGPTWDGANSVTHNDQHSICIDPSNADNFWFGNDGGVYKASWIDFPAPIPDDYVVSNFNDALPFTSFYSFDAHPSDVTRLIGGTQDNATPIATGDLFDWRNTGGGDGAGSGIAQGNPNIQYATSQFYSLNETTNVIDVWRTTNGWTTRSDISTTITGAAESILFIPPLTVSNTTPPQMYIGTEFLYRYNESTGTWSNRLGGVNFGERVRAIAVAPSNSSVLYVGTINGNVWRSTNSGVNWTQIDSGASAAESLPNRTVTSISVNDTNPNLIMVTLSGTGGGHVWRCLDASQPTASRVWADRSGSGATALPDVPANWVERDPFNFGSQWYCATDIGVYYTDDAGLNWYNMNQAFGLPTMRVDRLVANPGTNRLYAATWGRGAFRMLITNTSPQVTSFAFSSADVVGGYSRSATVGLNQIAAPGGQVVSVSSASSVFNGPSTTTVPAGSTSHTFSCSFDVVSVNTLVSVTAAANGGSAADTITVLSHELSAMVVPATIKGGDNGTGTVSLNYNAPLGGLVVPLADNQTFVSVPATVVVPWLSNDANFTINTSAITGASQNATISSTWHGSTVSDVVSITPVNLSGITVPTSVVGGFAALGTVTLSTTSPADSVSVNLSSDTPSVATVPASVVVPTGATSANFAISTSLVSANTNVQITATRGATSLADTIQVRRINITNMVLTPSTVTENARFRVGPTIDTAAPPGGIVLTLSTNRPKLVYFAPATITIPSGATTANPVVGRTFALANAGLTNNTSATVTCTFLGQSVNRNLVVTRIRP